MDISSLPSNSQSPKPEKADADEPKRLLKVVDGTVIRKKRSLGSRFTDVFGGTDGRNVADYVIFEVLAPALKDMLYDAVTSAVEQALFRGGRPSSGGRRPNPTSRGGNSHTNYNRVSSPSMSRRDETRPPPRRSRDTFNFDEVILASRRDAEGVINRMIDTIHRYDAVSVNDFYELIGENADHTGEKWGWVDLHEDNTGVRPFKGGYMLVLPRPEPL